MTTKTNKELNATLKTLRTEAARLYAKMRLIETTLENRKKTAVRDRNAAQGFRVIAIDSLRPGMKLLVCGKFVKVLSATSSSCAPVGLWSRRKVVALAGGKVKTYSKYSDVKVAL